MDTAPITPFITQSFNIYGLVKSPRSTYRHGDLRRALLDAGIELARSGGPDAVVLREATRRAGVAPNAAYRHFASREALLRPRCPLHLTRITDRQHFPFGAGLRGRSAHQLMNGHKRRFRLAAG